MRSCCGRSVRQGVFLSTVFLFALFCWNFGILIFFYTHPSAAFFIGELRNVLMDWTIEFSIIASGMTLTLGLALVFLPPSHGLALPVKVLGALVVVSGFGWLIASVLLGRRLNALFFQYLPSTTMMRSAMNTLQKDDKSAIYKGVKLIGSVVAGSVLNNVAVDAAVRLLGEPLNWCVYAATNPFIPVTVFGLAPVIHCLASVGVIFSYAGVLEAGGDGSEYVDADRIEWFYRLSKKEQHKVVDSRGYVSSDDGSSSSDSEDDSDSSLLVRKKGKSVASKAQRSRNVG
jgi:hypothetical protein